jgi:hypothetical protein
MGVRRDPAIPEGIFVPEEVILIAGPSQLQGVAEGLDGAEGVEHQVHLPTYRLPTAWTTAIWSLSGADCQP